MHETRTGIRADAIVDGQGAARRRQKGDEATLVDIAIPRVAKRSVNQRRTRRFDGVVKRATITFRRRRSPVRVVNISGGGVMIESGIQPRIGEVIGIEFEGFDLLEAVVRWVKKGRIGLDVGEGTINFG